MSANPIEVALAKISFHEAEATRLKKFVEDARALLSEAGTTPQPQPALSSSSASVPGSGTTITAPSIGSPSPTALVLDESEAILREANRPMLAADIYEKLIRRGVRINGKNPKGNLTAKFSTKRGIFHLNKETKLWSLTEWANKPRENEPPEGGSESDIFK